MPKNNKIKSVLIIGSGPIIIGQACEFDYSGTQAPKSLREEGVKVILINDNPATIMTDPSTADKVYMLPLTPESIVKILEENQIDSVLPTMGGQTALNLCKDCDEIGIWEKYNVNIIGVDLSTIEVTENRDEFRLLMKSLNIPVSDSIAVSNLEEAIDASIDLSFPLVVRPSFTLGGFGGGFASNYNDFEVVVKRGLDASPTNQVLIEKAVLGWKEYELELLRDSNDNVTIVCTIENFDPMGVHTGDSITVAPAMTLSDRTFQRMRDMAILMMRSLGRFAGGCNVQFAVEPETEKIIAVEINPRVSRSSALASKATGYPIAKISAKLALGYNLDEIKNPIVQTSALGFQTSDINEVCGIDPWFIEQIKIIVDIEYKLRKELNKKTLLMAKQNGFSDEHISLITGISESDIRFKRSKWGISRVFKSIDTCSAEFEAKTPYFYSTFENSNFCLTSQNESKSSSKKKVVILGSGPNRIGQGIEFDYACVHGVLGAKECGWETIMINNNPETVSTDFNLADKLYFEPVYLENVLDIIIHEKPDGVILQLGGQTALKLAKELNSLGVKILGTSFDGIDIAEDRERFYKILDKNNIPYPKYQVIDNIEKVSNNTFEFPLLVRPSYVIGGQRMRIIHNQEDLVSYCEKLLSIYEDNTIIIDKFLSDAIEVESDVISQDGSSYIIGIMEHIDKAGVHSGDSSAYLPTKNISQETLKLIQDYSSIICQELKVIGLINIQFVIKDGIVYVIEANPRSSRTVPFISKAYGVPYIKIATGIILGHIDLENFKFPERKLTGFAIKKPIFSTHKFNVDIELGPEMKSTGECIIFEN